MKQVITIVFEERYSYRTNFEKTIVIKVSFIFQEKQLSKKKDKVILLIHCIRTCKFYSYASYFPAPDTLSRDVNLLVYGCKPLLIFEYINQYEKEG